MEGLLLEEHSDFLKDFLTKWSLAATKQVEQKSLIKWKTYTIRRRTSDIQSKCLEIFRTSTPLQRSPEQIQQLKAMCNHLGFAENIPDKALEKFSQSIELTSYNHNDVIFLQGERPTNAKYYMLLDGKVEFLAVSGDAEDRTFYQRIQQMQKTTDPVEFRKRLGESVFLRTNGAFGEMALITGETRSASAVVQDYAHVITCTREIFRECLLVHQREKLELSAKMEFLKGRQRNLLSTWSTSQILRLSYDLSLENFQTGELLIKEGEKVTKIALVAKGEVALEKQAPFDSERPRRGSVNSIPEPIKIATLRSGTMVGDIEVFNNDKTYLYSARAKDPTSVYMISVAKFKVHFICSNGLTRNYLQESVDSRRQHYKSREAAQRVSPNNSPLRKPTTKDAFQIHHEKFHQDPQKMKKLSIPNLKKESLKPDISTFRSQKGQLTKTNSQSKGIIGFLLKTDENQKVPPLRARAVTSALDDQMRLERMEQGLKAMETARSRVASISIRQTEIQTSRLDEQQPLKSSRPALGFNALPLTSRVSEQSRPALSFNPGSNALPLTSRVSEQSRPALSFNPGSNALPLTSRVSEQRPLQKNDAHSQSQPSLTYSTVPKLANLKRNGSCNELNSQKTHFSQSLPVPKSASQGQQQKRQSKIGFEDIKKMTDSLETSLPLTARKNYTLQNSSNSQILNGFSKPPKTGRRRANTANVTGYETRLQGSSQKRNSNRISITNESEKKTLTALGF
eukprot:CAMPEP_0117750584 /NCGR_PEP_ID=MMETSP0947-20121206/10458_1 /TAXON_ID=44440 /ORGANISM="Chattonella subsalsa, Strain CCMP2191" /LENGTH=738 /DNA_ID=CAMNT_0005568785 /DNA_START=70 /DNA_END=2286 /DNA_ORIENTATION=+